MRAIISNEWIKLKGHPVYPILILVVMGLLILVVDQLKGFTFANTNNGVEGQSIGSLGLYEKGVIFQTISYVAGFFKYILVILFMLYASLDYRHKMHRKQVMEGWSRQASFFSKYLWIVVFVCVQTIILYLLGFALAMESEKSWSAYVYNPLFWAVEFSLLMAMGMFVLHLTKKSGLSMIVLLIYAIIAEPILAYRFSALKAVLPLSQSRALIEAPFSKYMGIFTGEEYVLPDFPTQAIVTTLLFIAAFTAFSWWRFSKTDL
ncbi:MAG: hypothetical protein LAT54_10625 [Cryomorphaceae bacterium]|nr:hypothetical protein [Cryomorphaceae bacterium]